MDSYGKLEDYSKNVRNPPIHACKLFVKESKKVKHQHTSWLPELYFYSLERIREVLVFVYWHEANHIGLGLEAGLIVPVVYGVSPFHWSVGGPRTEASRRKFQ